MKKIKQCSVKDGCGKILPLYNFHKCGNYYQSLCKNCRNKTRRNETLKNKEKYKIEQGIIDGTDKCFACGKVKIILEFKKSKNKKNGYERICLKCHNNNNREARNNDTGKARESARKSSRKRRLDPVIRKIDNEKSKQFFKDNPNYRVEYEKEKRKDPMFRLKKNLGRRIRYEISKNTTTAYYVGCSTLELKLHLEKQFYPNPETGEMMAWENYGLYGWHVDHIIPCSSAKTKDELEKLFHFTNLQPLWAKENLQKHAKLNWKNLGL